MTLEAELKIFDDTLNEVRHHNPQGYCAIQMMQKDITKRYFNGNYRAFEMAHSMFLAKQYGIDGNRLWEE